MIDETILLRRFGRQLRIFRKQRLMSREELSSKIRLPVKEVEDLEAGRTDPKLGTIFLIAKAIDVHPEELFLPSGGHDKQYYAYRFYLLKLLNNLSKGDLKKAIEVLRSLFIRE